MILIILSLVGALIARCPFAVRRSLSLMISLISAAGRISIVPQFNFTPGLWEMSLNCVIQISRFKHLNSAQLLLRFRVRTVCHCTFPFFQDTVTAVLGAEEVPQRQDCPFFRSSSL